MKHRGPDAMDFYLDENLSLGHTRLSIIDLSDKGNQPMHDTENEITITYNGEIYNHLELRKILVEKGYKFKSHTDTEVILYSYKEWGLKCLEKLIGMFAFCIYDKIRGTLFLARDHIGIKPLYYYKDKKRFIFSSIIQPILEHDIVTNPNKKLIRDFLLYNNTDHTDETFFSNIQKLPKGHYMIYSIKANNFKIKKWWSSNFFQTYNGSYASACKELRTLLFKSVSRRLMSDVPVGTCLSGGIDSSSIACIINSSSNTEIKKTFSATFPGFKKDETKYIDIVSKKTNLSNYKVNLTGEDFANDYIDFIKSMGEPVPTPSSYAQYKVFEMAKKNKVVVLLDGQGADELFAGYHYFFGFYIKDLILNLHIKSAIKEFIGLLKNNSYKEALLSFGFLFMPLSIKQRYFKNRTNISNKLYNDKSSETDFFQNYYTISNLSSALLFHLENKLEHLLKWEDRNSMAHSREARVPFLDKEIMNFVFTLPENFIINNGITKSILRESMSSTVPEKILQRYDKIGFFTPEDEWLKAPEIKKMFQSFFIDNEPLCQNFIDTERTKQMITAQFSSGKDYTKILWKTLFLESWLRTYKHELNIS